MELMWSRVRDDGTNEGSIAWWFWGVFRCDTPVGNLSSSSADSGEEVQNDSSHIQAVE